MIPRHIAALQSAYRSGQLRITDVVQTQLDRIAEQQPHLHAYISWHADSALKHAALQQQQLETHPNALPPLFGVGISIKDNMDVAGMKTSGGSFSQQHQPAATQDAAAVARLRAAGAIILGKANCHEFAFGGPSFDLPVPPATNPWKAGYFPGGSSSGSGTTVAAELCMASIGTDTAGSIRSPSTNCGLVGLKPTYGAVPLDGVRMLSVSLDHAGPLAHSVEDCERIFTALCPQAVHSAAPNRPIRLGIPTSHWGLKALLQPEVHSMMEGVQQQLQNAGVEIVPVSLPNLETLHTSSALLMMAEVAYVFGPKVRQHFDAYGQIFRGRVLVGENIPASAYLQATQDKLRLTQALAHSLQAVDALLLPGATAVAGPLNQVDTFYFLTQPNLNAIANLSGQPAIALPSAISEEGLPMGIQLLGKHHQDHALLHIAQRIETILDFAHQRDQHHAVTSPLGDKHGPLQ